MKIQLTLRITVCFNRRTPECNNFNRLLLMALFTYQIDRLIGHFTGEYLPKKLGHVNFLTWTKLEIFKNRHFLNTASIFDRKVILPSVFNLVFIAHFQCVLASFHGFCYLVAGCFITAIFHQKVRLFGKTVILLHYYHFGFCFQMGFLSPHVF